MRISAQLSALAMALTAIVCTAGGWAPCLIMACSTLMTVALQGAYPGGDEIIRLDQRDVSTAPCAPLYLCKDISQAPSYDQVRAVGAHHDASFDTFARNGTKLGRFLFSAPQMAQYGLVLRNHTGHDVIATKQGPNNYTISSFRWARSAPPDLTHGITKRDHYVSGTFNVEFGDGFDQDVVRHRASSAGCDLANQFVYNIFQYSPGPAYTAQIHADNGKLITRGRLTFQL